MDSPHPRSYVVLSCDIELDVMRTAIILTDTHRAHGRDGICFSMTNGGSHRVDLGSNGGRIGVKQVRLGVCFSAQGSEYLDLHAELL